MVSQEEKREFFHHLAKRDREKIYQSAMRISEELKRRADKDEQPENTGNSKKRY